MTTPVTSSSLEARLTAMECMLGITNSSTSKDIASRLDALQTSYDKNTTSTFRETCSESGRLMNELDAGTALTYQQVGSSAPLYYRRQQILASADTLKDDMDMLKQMIPLLLVGATGNNNQQKQSGQQQQHGQLQHQGSSGVVGGTGSAGSKKSIELGSRSTLPGSGGAAAAGGGSASSGKGPLLREDQVINAPIINSVSISREDQRRLDVAQLDILDLQKRTDSIARRVDNLLSCYQHVIGTVSAKMVLADEEIALREMEK